MPKEFPSDLKDLSEKDKADLMMMHDAGADAIAVSFVQSAEDVERVEGYLPKDCQMMIVSKIETQPEQLRTSILSSILLM